MISLVRVACVGLLPLLSVGCTASTSQISISHPIVKVGNVPNAHLDLGAQNSFVEIMQIAYLQTTRRELHFVEELIYISDAYKVSKCRVSRIMKELETHGGFKCSAQSNDPSVYARFEELIAKEISFLFFPLMYYIVTESRNGPSKDLALPDAINLLGTLSDSLTVTASANDYRIGHHMTAIGSGDPLILSMSMLDVLLDDMFSGYPQEVAGEARKQAMSQLVDMYVEKLQNDIQNQRDQQSQAAKTMPQLPGLTSCAQAAQLRDSVSGTLNLLYHFEDDFGTAVNVLFDDYACTNTRATEDHVVDISDGACEALEHDYEANRKLGNYNISQTQLERCISSDRNDPNSDLEISLTLNNMMETDIVVSDARVSIEFTPRLRQLISDGCAGDTGSEVCPPSERDGSLVKRWLRREAKRGRQDIRTTLSRDQVVPSMSEANITLLTEPLDFELGVLIRSCIDARNKQPRIINMYSVIRDMSPTMNVSDESAAYRQHDINGRFLCPNISFRVEIIDTDGRMVGESRVTFSEIAMGQGVVE